MYSELQAYERLTCKLSIIPYTVKWLEYVDSRMLVGRDTTGRIFLILPLFWLNFFLHSSELAFI